MCPRRTSNSVQTNQEMSLCFFVKNLSCPQLAQGKGGHLTYLCAMSLNVMGDLVYLCIGCGMGGGGGGAEASPLFSPPVPLLQIIVVM